MNLRNLLTNEEIEIELKDVPLWKCEGNTLVREIVASDFPSAIGFVNAVAIVAESMDHHPDILVYGWNKVRIITSTHSAGGLTKLDFELAKKIDNLNFFK
ncbi:MAG: 4a-hydroxytetrahydrobiopterin dehydratase [Ignavibacteria bacterium]|nr:4a-hydroxytetrahydrobiopterin dehydratase [Ignavibacteria bacterium]